MRLNIKVENFEIQLIFKEKKFGRSLIWRIWMFSRVFFISLIKVRDISQSTDSKHFLSTEYSLIIIIITKTRNLMKKRADSVDWLVSDLTIRQNFPQNVFVIGSKVALC